MQMTNRVAPVMIVALAIMPLTAAPAQERTYQGQGKVHYAKTELDKATGKCKLTVIGGSLLGAALGGILGGGKGAAIGAGTGLAAGASVCAILVSNAKHKDQIIAAQLAAAASDTAVTTTWTDDGGQPVSITAQRGAEQQLNGAQLIPIRYSLNGQEKTSPVLAATDMSGCRTVSTSFGNGKDLPKQIYCRTPEGNYEPYNGPTA